MNNRILHDTDYIQIIQHNTPKPKGFKSWKKYWCDQSGEEWPRKCRFHGCDNNADGSPHVIVNSYEDNEYIIPMCNNCISTSKAFPVYTGTIAVYIDKEKITTELMDSLVESFGGLSLRAGVQVKNVVGTGHDKSRDYGTWKKFYMGENDREWPKTCRIRNCTEPADGGAHVHVQGKHGVFIVPMCIKEHNTSQNTDSLPVKKGTIAVRVDQGDTKRPNETSLPAGTFSLHDHHGNTTRPAETGVRLDTIPLHVDQRNTSRPAETGVRFNTIPLRVDQRNTSRPAETGVRFNTIPLRVDQRNTSRPAETGVRFNTIPLRVDQRNTSRPAETGVRLNTIPLRVDQRNTSRPAENRKNVCCQCVIV